VPDIEVSRTDLERSRSRYDVRISDDGGSTTEHTVTLSRDDQERLGSRYPSPEAFIRACFAFLLEREPKESILRSFDVSQISDYYPEFEPEIVDDAP
jgi:hypothetical protein